MSESLSFFSLPPNCRGEVASYLYNYSSATTEERACFELISFLPENKWDKVTIVFQEKVKELTITPPPEACVERCRTALASTAKKQKLYLGSQFRLVEFSYMTPSFSELVFQFQESIHRAKNVKEIPVAATLKLISLLANKSDGIDERKIHEVTTRALQFGIDLPEARRNNQVRCFVQRHIKVQNWLCSAYFRLKEFLEVTSQYVKSVQRYPQVFNSENYLFVDEKFTKRSSHGEVEVFEKMLQSKNFEERSFCYRWLEKIEDVQRGKILITTLTEENLNGFKGKYQNHKNPRIKQLAAFCIEICEKESFGNKIRRQAFAFMDSFLIIYGHKDDFIKYGSFLFQGEFMKFFNEIEKMLSFLNLPKDKNAIINITQYRLAVAKKLSLEDLSVMEKKVEAFKKSISNSLIFVYKTNYFALQQLQKVLENKSAGVISYLSEYFQDRSKKDRPEMYLPKPESFDTFFNEVAAMQYDIVEEAIPKKDKKTEVKERTDVKESEDLPPPVSAPKPPTLKEILNRRDFPLHPFPYDERVIKRFLELRGDWAKANSNIQNHAFPDFIDRFVGTDYSKKVKDGWINTTTGHHDLFYVLFADVIIGNDEFPVRIEYVKGSDTIWYHRYMNRASKAQEEVAAIRSAELEKSAKAAAKGREEFLPKQVGIMNFDPVTETVVVDFKTYKIRLHRQR